MPCGQAWQHREPLCKHLHGSVRRGLLHGDGLRVCNVESLQCGRNLHRRRDVAHGHNVRRGALLRRRLGNGCQLPCGQGRRLHGPPNHRLRRLVPAGKVLDGWAGSGLHQLQCGHLLHGRGRNGRCGHRVHSGLLLRSGHVAVDDEQVPRRLLVRRKCNGGYHKCVRGEHVHAAPPDRGGRNCIRVLHGMPQHKLQYKCGHWAGQLLIYTARHMERRAQRHSGEHSWR